MRIINIFSFLLIISSCGSPQKELAVNEDLIEFDQLTKFKYAEGFTIKDFENYKLITVNEAWKDVGESYRYVLYENKRPENIKDAYFIKVPIKSMACMSLTHVAFLEKLGVENSITGISGCDYVNSKIIKAEIEKERIKEIGQEQSVNFEMLVESSPDIVMTFGINSTSNGSINKMTELGLQVVLNSEYMETHPLGKAEWIKFLAAFYNKSKEADSIFNYTEREYLSLVELTKEVEEKPTVFTGMPWSGSWYVPGGKSFQAQLFKDAGAQYLWLDNEEKSSLVKSKEIIIDEAFNADFWLNQNSYKSVISITNFDEKFKKLSSVKKDQLYNNNKRENNNGGNDYWESGVVNPQIILRDLIKIFHPNLLEHEFYYYRKLE